MITVTRSPKAVCPVVDPSIQPVFADQVVNGWWQRLDLSGPMVDALNQGAGLPALKRAVSHATYDGKPAGIPPEAIFAKDVTGDGVPEIIFDENWLMIFTCHDGQFREVLKWNSSFTDFVQKPTIADMNLDGLAEIVAPLRFNANYVNEVTFEILRWDGNNFVNLVPEKDMTFNGQIDWSVRDTDRNGTLELVIHNWPSTSPDADVHGPWRYETTALTWNGTNFVQLPTELDPPEYRFQAVQDGDRAMRCCQYLKAVRFFNLAINDPNLKGWGYSIEHFRQRQEAQGDQMEGKPIPTLLPLDPNETPTLKAYAHYRLLLAYVLLHEDKLAETVYQSLQKGHPSEKPGYQYAQLGKMFWEEYEKEHNISAGCAKAIQYTQDNEQLVLEPINNYRMGFQNLSYEVRDICSY